MNWTKVFPVNTNEKKISYSNINIRKKSTNGASKEMEVNSFDSCAAASLYLWKETSA